MFARYEVEVNFKSVILPFCFQKEKKEGFVRKRGGGDNTWQMCENKAWLRTYEHETPEDRRGDRWIRFSQMMWLVHGVHRTNTQCGNHVS